MTGVVRTSAWDLAVESVEEALADGVVPSLGRLGRLGGDEFAALLIEAGPETAGSFLTRLHERLPEEISASAGAAFLPTDATEPEGLIEVADRRLYEDKRASSRAA